MTYLRVAKKGGILGIFTCNFMKYLRVAKEGGRVEVVAPVPARNGPLPVEQGLAPGLLDADDASVDEVTQVYVGEDTHEIRKRHP